MASNPAKNKKKQKDEGKDKENPDAELDAAWHRSPIGIRVNPKRYIKGLVYTEDDKLENKKQEEKEEKEKETSQKE